MRSQLIVAVAVEALDGYVLDRSGQKLDLHPLVQRCLGLVSRRSIPLTSQIMWKCIGWEVMVLQLRGSLNIRQTRNPMPLQTSMQH